MGTTEYIPATFQFAIFTLILQWFAFGILHGNKFIAVKFPNTTIDEVRPFIGCQLSWISCKRGHDSPLPDISALNLDSAHLQYSTETAREGKEIGMIHPTHFLYISFGT